MSVTECPVRRKCGGCQLSNLSYPEQLRLKEKYVTSLVGRYARVLPIVAAENPYHYRAKVQAAFGTTRGGKIISGVYQSSSHTIVNVDSCLIEDERADRIIVTIRKLLSSFKLPVFDENTGTGFLRHVLVRCGHVKNEVMVVLVTGTPAFPKKNDFIAALLRAHPYITTVVQNINGGFTNLVLGKDEKVLFGKGYIEDTLCSLTFRISPRSFYQVNPAQTEKLYGIAVDFASLGGSERVIDAYCGTGTIGLIASKNAREVIGAEINAGSVEDARANARLNGIENAVFVCRDAGEFMVELAQRGEKADIVFLDPPRAGCDKKFLDSLLRLAPKKIVYISCKPETLARDMRVLTDGGYRTRKIQPVDMFPHTRHVENVVLMTSRKS